MNTYKYMYTYKLYIYTYKWDRWVSICKSVNMTEHFRAMRRESLYRTGILQDTTCLCDKNFQQIQCRYNTPKYQGLNMNKLQQEHMQKGELESVQRSRM